MPVERLVQLGSTDGHHRGSVADRKVSKGVRVA